MQAPPVAKPDPYVGREILSGQFKVLERVGSGGMGAVYRAQQPSMDRFVAVKILHSKFTNRKDLVSRFRREARAMSHLTHPNTAKVYLYGQLEDNACYIVMEYLEGRNLGQLVRQEGPLDPARAVAILVQACGALEEAHQKGIIHRDLKPENIFLCKQGGIENFAKVLDFGLAKVTEREMQPGSLILTQEGMVFGTPEFMSPEQAQGKTLDARSDVYSLAVILYELLTGKLPFDARSPMEFITLHVQATPIPLSVRAPDRSFPPGLEDVILKAMAKRPEDRYQSAGEFAAHLAAVVPDAAVREALSALPDAALALAATQPSRPAMRSENAPPSPIAENSVRAKSATPPPGAPAPGLAPSPSPPAKSGGLPVAALILIGVVIGLVLSLGVLLFFVRTSG
ncbi:MAG: serine/threonine-protein kinase [Polyangiales bacterium]